MKKPLLLKRMLLIVASTVLSLGSDNIYAQTYTWAGETDANFNNVLNWSAGVDFSKTLVTPGSTSFSPTISSSPGVQSAIYNNDGANLTVSANYEIANNNYLNGTTVVNNGAIFSSALQFYLGKGAAGTLTVENGTIKNIGIASWTRFFIGVAGGTATANINNGGVIDGGQDIQVGTGDDYPIAVLNVNTGGSAIAYWNTRIGPNSIVNINGGTLNTGANLEVGFVGTNFGETITGTLGTTVGTLNINTGTVNVNSNNTDYPLITLHANAKIIIDAGSLILSNLDIDTKYSENLTKIADFVTNGQIAAVPGKTIEVTNDGSSTITVKAVALLPVSLISFSAKPKNNTALLNWSTSSEQNNSHFRVSHSTDGLDFTLLTIVGAAENGNVKNSYSYIHKHPLAGNNYYRLEQVDLDGIIKKTEVRIVKFSLSDEQTVTIYPNPTQNEVRVNFTKDTYKNARLINLQGKVLAKKSIAINDTEILFNMSSLNAGNYLIQLDGKKTATHKVVKN